MSGLGCLTSPLDLDTSRSLRLSLGHVGIIRLSVELDALARNLPNIGPQHKICNIFVILLVGTQIGQLFFYKSVRRSSTPSPYHPLRITQKAKTTTITYSIDLLEPWTRLSEMLSD
jgi:hypothetical protein